MENSSVAKCDCGRNIYDKHRYSCDDCFERNRENDENNNSTINNIELPKDYIELIKFRGIKLDD